MKLVGLLLTTIFLNLTQLPALAAQDYPARPITMIVGYAPGGGVDVFARLAAQQISILLGQPIVVENRPGANSAIATRMAKRAEADGYTLLFSSYVLTQNLMGLKEPGYKFSDFVCIGGYSSTGHALFVNTKSSGAKTLQDFIEFGRKNQGKLTYGSLGTASLANLSANNFDAVAKIGWREIPFKGAADAVNAVVNGTVDAYLSGPASVRGSLDLPNVAVLAVTSKGRSSLLPNVPTFVEQGIPINDGYSFSLFAPAGTPQPIIDKLRKALEDAKKNPDNRRRIQEAGQEVYEGTWQDLSREMLADSKAFGAALKRLGIEPQ